MSDRFVTVAQYEFLPEAETVRMHLEMEGIRAMLADAETVSTEWTLGNAVGYIKLQVPESQVTTAIPLVEQMRVQKNANAELRLDGEDKNNCLACGAEIPVADSACAVCGWSYASDDAEANDDSTSTPDEPPTQRISVSGWSDQLRSMKQAFILLMLVPFFAGIILITLAGLGLTFSFLFPVGKGIKLVRFDNRRRIFLAAGTAISGLLVIGLVASWIVAGALVAPSPKVIGDPPTDLPAESITLDSDSGSRVAGWHVRSEPSKGVVVLLHGIRGSRRTMLDRARLLHAAEYSVVLIDFQGHGESPGQQITVGHLEKHDVRAAVEFARKNHPGEKIGVIGVSLGGASALLASPLKIDALVLESVYPTISAAVHSRVAAQLGQLSSVPAELLLVQLKFRLGIARSQLRPIDFISKVACPVFVISGNEDLHTTAAETESMFAIANEPKELWLVDGAAHIDLLEASLAEYKRRVFLFLNRYLRATVPFDRHK